MIKNSKIPLEVASYLIVLLPIFLISGPLLTDISIVLIDIIFLYFLFRFKDFKFLNNIYFKYSIIFCLFISLRSLFLDQIDYLSISLKSSGLYFRFIILIFAINYFLEKNVDLIKKFTLVFLITISFLILDAYIQFFFGRNIFGFENINSVKLNGLFDDRGVLGSYLVRLLPLIFAVIINQYGLKKNEMILSIILSLIVVLIFISGSRSSFYLSILFLFLIIFLFKGLRTKVIILSFVSIISISVISNFNKKIDNVINYSLKDPVVQILHTPDNNVEKISFLNKKFYIFTHIYQAHYFTAFNMFKDNKIFGQGNKMFRFLCKEERFYVNYHSCSTHPHNFYIQLLAENGIIGFLFIFIIFISASYLLLRELVSRNIKNIKFFNDTSLFILIGIFMNLWPIVPSGNFYNNWLSALIYLPIGFYFYFNKKEKNA
jgi:O-antigen ligase